LFCTNTYIQLKKLLPQIEESLIYLIINLLGQLKPSISTGVSVRKGCIKKYKGKKEVFSIVQKNPNIEKLYCELNEGLIYGEIHPYLIKKIKMVVN